MSRSAYYSRANSYSRSYNAEVAEDEGRCPMSRAKIAVAEQFGCSQSVAKVALELVYDGEWHHVGKYANEVAYYDTTDNRLGGIIREILRHGGAKKFAERRERLRTTRHAERSRFSEGGWYVKKLAWKRQRAAEAAQYAAESIFRAACKFAGGAYYVLRDESLSPRDNAARIVGRTTADRLDCSPRFRRRVEDWQIRNRLYYARLAAGVPGRGVQAALEKLLAGELDWQGAINFQIGELTCSRDS